MEELEAENQRLKDILKVNSISLSDETEFMTMKEKKSKNVKTVNDVRKVEEKEHNHSKTNHVETMKL